MLFSTSDAESNSQHQYEVEQLLYVNSADATVTSIINNSCQTDMKVESSEEIVNDQYLKLTLLVLSLFLTGRMFVRRTYFGQFDEL